ncbi:hypothetical protein AB0H34_37435 [Saccharopolyspora shandongensis]|uniref:hypothetical protein n=1 Tax=Saccharopolyspora shandongensis TaxID=418495 RepID=UPI0033F6E2CA
MAESLEEVERRIEGLRAEVRRAAMSGDSTRTRELRAELRRAERAWDDALVALAPPEHDPDPVTQPSALLSLRDQVHQVLTLLGAPSAPKLIATVNNAFFGGRMASAQLTSLRRDEERSFRSSPHARPYYLCGALTADRLVPARGLVAVSTWSLPSRVVGPLSARVDFLAVTTRLAEQVDRMAEPTLPALTLLWQFAANVPGAAESFDAMRPVEVVEAARAELAVHHDADRAHREEAASRARTQLDEVHQLFGSALKVVRRATPDK